jgi:hypothetical protein
LENEFVLISGGVVDPYIVKRDWQKPLGVKLHSLKVEKKDKFFKGKYSLLFKDRFRVCIIIGVRN